jgi:hypothetical protein
VFLVVERQREANANKRPRKSKHRNTIFIILGIVVAKTGLVFVCSRKLISTKELLGFGGGGERRERVLQELNVFIGPRTKLHKTMSEALHAVMETELGKSFNCEIGLAFVVC